MTRTPKSAKPRATTATATPNAPHTSPKSHRKQQRSTHNAIRHPASQDVSSPALAPAAQSTPNRPPATTAMSAEMRLAWNLKILKRHDPLITRIFDQAPYAVLYTFAHANNQNIESGQGKKYEGTWDKSGIEGTVFIIERSAAPHYGFFLLNRGGTSSIVQMFHKDDNVELGAGPQFLTFRPGVWDRATTPYTEPFTRCEKPSVICLWLSEETAGPRFAEFINKAKEFLAHEYRVAEGTSTSPPLTPLSQFRYNEGGMSSDDENFQEHDQSFASQQSSYLHQPATNEVQAQPLLDPLDQLFAGLSHSHPFTSDPNIPSTNLSHLPQHSTAHSPPLPDPNINLLHAILPGAFPSLSTSSILPPPAPPLPPAVPPTRSLLDDIFASAALGSSAAPMNTTFTNLGPLAAAFQPPPPAPESLPVTPPPTSMNTAQAAQRFSGSARHSNDDDDDDIVLMPNGNVNGNRHSDEEALGKEQEVLPPSPSLIPNPLHTPLPAQSIKQGKGRNRKTNVSNPNPIRSIASNKSIAGLSGPLPELREAAVSSKQVHSQGQTRRPYVPQNDHEEISLDVESAMEALLETHSNYMHGGVNKNASKDGVKSKDNFIREVLSLIHNDPSFGNELYARYLSRV